MRFMNRGESIQVRIEVNGEFQAILLNPGEEIDLPEQQGINYKLERVTTQGKIGETIVETKQEYTPDNTYFKELVKIKGIGKKTAEDIVEWGTKEKLLEHIKERRQIPFRDDIVKLLEKEYGQVM